MHEGVVSQRNDVLFEKHVSSFFSYGHYREGYLFEAIGITNALPVEPQITNGFNCPTVLSVASAEVSTTPFDSGDISITDLCVFADPWRPFEFAMICKRSSICWECVSRNLQITAEIAGGHALPSVSLCSSLRYIVDRHAECLRVTISPAWWSHSTLFTIVGIYYAGQLLNTPFLPASVKVLLVNHVPSTTDRLTMASKQGDFAGVLSAIEDGCSTEELNDQVCTMISIATIFSVTTFLIFSGRDSLVIGCCCWYGRHRACLNRSRGRCRCSIRGNCSKRFDCVTFTRKVVFVFIY